MKVRANIWSITWRYLIFALIVVAAVFGMFFQTFFQSDPSTGQLVPLQWGTFQYLLVILSGGILIFFYFMSAFTYYYVIESKHFTMRRFWKEYVFDYKNIEFVDIEESRRKGQVIIYTKKSRTKYLIGDRKGVLLETVIKKCPQTMTVDEFRRAHPEERY